MGTETDYAERGRNASKQNEIANCVALRDAVCTLGAISQCPTFAWGEDGLAHAAREKHLKSSRVLFTLFFAVGECREGLAEGLAADGS